MKFAGLAIQGIRSFVGDHVFHFPDTHGTFFVGGDNQKYPDISPNGCGKSSIWDALCWVFYNKTTRGQIAGDVANWTREYATIGVIDFQKDGTNYSITRTWDPVSLNLQIENDPPKVVAQSVIDELVGLSYDMFLAIVVMSQFGQPFMALGRAKKLEWFSTVLGLDVWTDKSDAAKDDRDKFKKERDKYQLAADRGDAALEAEGESLRREQERVSAWSVNHDKSVELAEQFLGRSEDAHSTMSAEVARLRTKRSDDLDWLREAQRTQEDAYDKIDRVVADRDKLNIHIDNLGNRIREIDTASRELENIEGDCPTCRQDVPDKYLKTVLSVMETQARELNDEAAPLASDRDRANARIIELNGQYGERESGISDKRSALERLDASIVRAEQRATGASNELARAEDRLQRMKAETSPHTDAVADFERTIQELVNCRADDVFDRDAWEADRVTAHELVQYFKDTRLWICEQAMSEYAAVMNSSLEQLGLAGWDVACDLEKPTKSGKSTTRGFQILIKSPDSPDWVPWESWSGGETQRLILGGSVAFSDLACSRLGVSTSMEVWDEPTKHLSPGGVEDLLAYLHARARRLKRQIFLVDHRSIEAGEFSGSYTVVMDKQGSRIESDIQRRNARCTQVTNKDNGRRRFSTLRHAATN